MSLRQRVVKGRRRPNRKMKKFTYLKDEEKDEVYAEYRDMFHDPAFDSYNRTELKQMLASKWDASLSIIDQIIKDRGRL